MQNFRLNARFNKTEFAILTQLQRAKFIYCVFDTEIKKHDNERPGLQITNDH
jgi:hypothetical protein